MKYLFLDVETSSEVVLSDVGAVNYLHHPSTKLACYSWYISDTGLEDITLDNISSNRIPMLNFLHPDMSEEYCLVAHNIFFDYTAIKVFLPDLANKIVDFIDTRALCNIHNIRGSLQDACTDLGLSQKFEKGKDVMRMLNNPKKPLTYEQLSEEDRQLLITYCNQDVVMCYSLYQKLIAGFSNYEKQIFKLTFKSNMRGFRVDVPFLIKANEILELFKDYAIKKLPELIPPEAKVETYGQGDKIAAFFGLPNSQAATLEKFSKTLTDPKLQEFLSLTVLMNKQAPIKVLSALLKQREGLIFDTMLYSGTLSGRYTSYDLQIQNFIRTTPKKMYAAYNSIMDDSYDLSQVPQLLANACRGMIIPREGNDLIILDYSQIEARIAAVVCEDEEMINAFKNNEKVYEKMASIIFNVPVESVLPGQRTAGKVTVLGAMYGMGAARFAEDNDVSVEFALQCLNSYKTARYKVPQFWKKLERWVVHIVRNKIETDNFLGVINIKYVNDTLHIILPSGRPIIYPVPEVGINPKFDNIAFKYYSKKHSTSIFTWGGELTSHICQGISRDLMVAAMVELDKWDQYNLLFTVHDELVYEAEHFRYTLDEFKKIVMDSKPAWAEKLPLNFVAGVYERYCKE